MMAIEHENPEQGVISNLTQLFPNNFQEEKHA